MASHPPVSQQRHALAVARAPQKPVLTVFMTSQGIPAALNMGPRGTLPTYIFPVYFRSAHR